MQYSREEKTMWLEDWSQSGKSAWSYAKANGINPQTFTKWTKTGNEKNTCLVEVSSKVVQSACHDKEILIEKGEIKIHIPVTLGYMELGAIFGALG